MLRLSSLFCFVVSTTGISRRASRRPASHKRKVRCTHTHSKADLQSDHAKGSKKITPTTPAAVSSATAPVAPSPIEQVEKAADVPPRPAFLRDFMIPSTLPSAAETSNILLSQSPQRATWFLSLKEKLPLLTPSTLHARLRSVVMQVVLLSPEPLQPSVLCQLVHNVVDVETADLFACASHAVKMHEALRRRRAGERRRNESGRAINSCDYDAHAPTRSDRTEAAKEGSTFPAGSDAPTSKETIDEQLANVGRAFAAAYRRSVVPLVAELRRIDSQRMRSSTSATEPGASTHQIDCFGSRPSLRGIPAQHDVAQWMLLHILFCDAEFRVSAYSGAVCYPTLPSLLLATSDRLQDPHRTSECYALQWLPSTNAGAASAAATLSATQSSPIYRSQVSSTNNTTKTSRKDPVANGASAPTPPQNASNFRWLNGAAGRPPWTMAHGVFVIYNAYVGRRQSAESCTTESGRSREDDTADATTISVAAAATEAVQDPGGTSGHPLVDYFIQQAASTRFPAAVDASAQLEHKAAAKAFPTMGWNEGTQGSAALQRCVAELSNADGLFGVNMARCATMRQPSGELYHANLHLIFGSFRYFLSVPISVTRLSAMLRWNLTLHHAGIYRSFFYFLLVMAANETVHRLSDGVQQRLRAILRCADVFGERSSSSSCHGTPNHQNKAAAAVLGRQRVQQEVRQALQVLAVASSAPREGAHAGKSSTQPSAFIKKQICDTFTLEREVVHHPLLSDNRVTTMLFLRVLPHARPGSGSCSSSEHVLNRSAAHASPADNSSSFRGYPLQYVEVLPTWACTPEEVLLYLYRRHVAEQRAEGVASTDHGWLEKYEEPYLLVCAMSSVTVCGRLRAAAERFASIVDSGAMTLRQLSIVTLWAHEYGTSMAAEMLFVQLMLNPQYVRLHPPSADHADVKAAAKTSYEEWTVEFL